MRLLPLSWLQQTSSKTAVCPELNRSMSRLSLNAGEGGFFDLKFPPSLGGF